MKEYTIVLSDEVAEFYSLIAEKIDYRIEMVLSDCLLRFAGELSMREINNKKYTCEKLDE